jgi:hypothetical protein
MCRIAIVWLVATVWIVKSPSPGSPAATSWAVSSAWQNYIRRRNCDTANGSNWEIVNCINVRASGINSRYSIRREVTCRVTYTQHVTILSNNGVSNVLLFNFLPIYFIKYSLATGETQQIFGNWICFRPQVWGGHVHCWLRWPLSKEPSGVDVSNSPEDGNRSRFRNVVFSNF